MVRLGQIARWLLFGAMAIYMLLPIVAVALYSFATRWTSNILPDGYTLIHYYTAFTDPRLVGVLTRTTGLALAATVVVMLLVVPAVYWQRVRNPRIRLPVELAAAIPFALPFIVIAFGILSLTGQILPQIQGTFVLLLLGHSAIAFSFMYWSVDGAAASANIARLNEAALCCGAAPLTILWRIVLPNISAGIASGAMLVFATSFGEFALVQVLAGSRFETISLYSLNLLGSADANYNVLAVLTMITFVFIFIISVSAVYLNGGRTTTLLSSGEQKS